ncbi:MAG: hypothetical protein LCH58_04460 [Bacteroidetes bacterium]|uniref:hypothetical protein n=1 Tax=Phnomibacter sp. TaxID=2836217 RepID=UPI002FDF08C0|nr:hypothetical protein [Bacteroidota bacterium]
MTHPEIRAAKVGGMTIVAKHYPLKFWFFRRFGGYVEKASLLDNCFYSHYLKLVLCKVNKLPATSQANTAVI